MLLKIPPLFEKGDNMRRSRSQNIPESWRSSREDRLDFVEKITNDIQSRTTDIVRAKIENENKNSIDHSGNSDVDVKVDVHVDTTAIGFALLCSLLATKQMNNEEFEEAVRRLENLTNQKESIFSAKDVNNLSNVRPFMRRRNSMG